ncbi:MAG: manganese efflux pump MntP family protein [Alphaproteobacteria bacterium]|nr:manganese efflux pump MntP family protein [Alphaproteobacteria bacterium]
MSLLSTSLLALSMSADAFAVSIGKGVALDKPSFRDAMKNGLVFGMTEACAPVLGWFLGGIAAGMIEAYDHWIAFGLLLAIGLHMIVEGVRNQNCEVELTKPKDQSLPLLMLTAVGTSIDSMAVGVSWAFIGEPIFPIALAIGLATFTMSTLGLMIGHCVGCRLGRFAEILGGLGLIAIGAKILLQHLDFI